MNRYKKLTITTKNGAKDILKFLLQMLECYIWSKSKLRKEIQVMQTKKHVSYLEKRLQMLIQLPKTSEIIATTQSKNKNLSKKQS